MNRVAAVMLKELAEFRRNRMIVITACILPLVFLVSPTASILALKATVLSTVLQKRVDAALFFPLLIPVFIPATMSAYSVAGEREQGTLEPVLTTPVSTVEFVAGKAAAIFAPAVGIAYLIFGVFLAIVRFAASSAVGTAVLDAPQVPAELVFIPLLAAWAIWVGMGISARTAEIRVAQQLSILASLPPVAVAALMSFQVIAPTFAIVAALAGGLLVIDCVACFLVARLFNREWLVTGGKAAATS
jgi:ABC-type Na+ efflux pump permease subunit